MKKSILLFAITVSVLFPTDAVEQKEPVKVKQTMPSLYEYEKLVKDMVYKLNRLNTDLKYVKNEETAKRAIPSISRLLNQFNSLNEKMAKMPPPSKEMQDKLSKKYESDLTASAQEFTSLVGELANKDYAAGLLQVIKQPAK